MRSIFVLLLCVSTVHADQQSDAANAIQQANDAIAFVRMTMQNNAPAFSDLQNIADSLNLRYAAIANQVPKANITMDAEARSLLKGGAKDKAPADEIT